MDRKQTVRRRLRSITVLAIAFVAGTVALPLVLAAAALFDTARFVTGRGRFVAVRLTLVGWVYLAAECVGVLGLGALWLVSLGGRMRGLLLGGTYAIQRWWNGLLFRTIRSLFRLRLEVHGTDALSPGPVMVFMRHASIIDNLLPSVLITAPTGIKLRYVLKRELLTDPALDIAGSRLPNHFVDRTAADPAKEAAAVGALGSQLGADEGVLIYPEGTRFTEERRARVLERLQSTSPARHARAAAWSSVLPPRVGGPLALLDAEPPADVVIAAHAGLDGFSHISKILSGGLVGATVRVRFERFAHHDIPFGPEARIDWLYDRWEEIDRWIAAHE